MSRLSSLIAFSALPDKRNYGNSYADGNQNNGKS